MYGKKLGCTNKCIILTESFVIYLLLHLKNIDCFRPTLSSCARSNSEFDTILSLPRTAYPSCDARPWASTSSRRASGRAPRPTRGRRRKSKRVAFVTGTGRRLWFLTRAFMKMWRRTTDVVVGVDRTRGGFTNMVSSGGHQTYPPVTTPGLSFDTNLYPPLG